MKMYKVSTLGAEIKIAEGAIVRDAVSVEQDMRDGVEYDVKTPPTLAISDALRAISAYLFFAKGLPPSIYTISLNGRLTPIPVPRKSAPRFGGSIGRIALMSKNIGDCGLEYYDIATERGICRLALFDEAPTVDFYPLGKELIRAGAEGGVLAAAALYQVQSEYRISVCPSASLLSLAAPIGAAAYLIVKLYDSRKCRIFAGDIYAECDAISGGVSVFDTAPTVTKLLS